MKVLQINTVYKYESTGRIAYEIKMVSEANGIEAYVAYGYKAVAHNDARTYCMQGKWRRKWNILKTRIWGKHGFYNKVETCRLIKYIDSIQPDIIHLHNIHNHYVNVEMLFRYIKEKDIPVVWTLHDCWTFTGWCPHFDFIKCDKWKKGCHHCPQLKGYPRTYFFDRSKELYNLKRKSFSGVKSAIVTPSMWLANMVKESFLKDNSIVVINNGVDTDQFKPCGDYIKNRLGIQDKKMILAVAARLAERKGAQYLLELPSRLNEDEVLVLLGVTKEQKESTQKNNCICVTYTNSLHELAEYYSGADVFINPTLEDTFPTTNIEALSCGTPIVTFRTGGSVEPIDDRTGIIVEKNDMEGLLMAIRIVLDKGKEVYTHACRQKALTLYNAGTQYQKYIDLYREILSKKENHA